MKKIFLITLVLSKLIFSNQLPNDIRWVVKSDEYISICHQTYNTAIQEMNKIIKNNNSKNLAVIMDLDETVLNNSQYQVELTALNQTFNMDSWANWVNREEATLVPGSERYIKLLRKHNIQIIYISNRMDERLDATKNNLKKLDIYSSNDIFLLRKNKEDKKYIRRDEVYNSTGRMKDFKKFKVVQYLGDAMGDFPEGTYNLFGVSHFVFPNPMYGKW